MSTKSKQNPDSVDRKLLALLEQDARISFAELAEQVGMSKSPCWNRVKDFEKTGWIRGYTAMIDPTELGLEIRALVHVVVEFNRYRQFEQAIIEHASVRSCHAVTGDFDYVLEILATDIKHFDTLLRADLSHLPGVQRFQTSISTRMVKSDGPYSNMYPNQTAE